MAETCAWHQTDDCLQKTGVLRLEQRIDGSLIDPSDAAEFARVWGTDRGVSFFQELGTFCTTSALLSWLEANTGAMKVPVKLGGPGRGGSRKPGANADQRPRVYRSAERRQR